VNQFFKKIQYYAESYVSFPFLGYLSHGDVPTPLLDKEHPFTPWNASTCPVLYLRPVTGKLVQGKGFERQSIRENCFYPVK